MLPKKARRSFLTARGKLWMCAGSPRCRTYGSRVMHHEILCSACHHSCATVRQFRLSTRKATPLSAFPVFRRGERTGQQDARAPCKRNS